jgi:hypothetical protein
MHSDWFNGIEILQRRCQHGEKVGYCYPSGLEKTLCKWDIYVPLVTKGLRIGGAVPPSLIFFHGMDTDQSMNQYSSTPPASLTYQQEKKIQSSCLYRYSKR